MRIRPATQADAPAIGRVHVATWRSTYPGMMPQALLDGLDEGRSAQRWLARVGEAGKPLLVAEHEGEVVGFASGGPAREGFPDWVEGELYALYLDDACQGQGWGKALVQAFLEALRAEGHRSMGVWVVAANPVRHFYAHLGGQPAGEKVVELGGAMVSELAFAWRELPLGGTEG